MKKNNIYNKVLAGAFYLLLTPSLLLSFTACQDRDLPGSGEMQVASPDVTTINGTPSGDNNYDYTITWPQSSQGATMQVAVYKNGTQMQSLTPCPSGSFTLKNLETNQLYEFLFKYANNDALSNGVMTSYTRPGASAPSDLKFEQIDISDDQRDMQVSWKASSDATSYILKLANGDGSRVIEETVNGTSYLLKDVAMKERWEATLIAQNNEGKALPIYGSGKVGGKIPAFLSEYATPEELVANGDDDEASAWLWFQENYPKGEYVYFGNINTVEDIEDYRMLFWSRQAMPMTSGTSPKSPRMQLPVLSNM